MSDINVSRDFKFFRMWPRNVFHLKEKNGSLSIKQVEDLMRPGVYVLYKGDELYYVGKAHSLFSRLHDHSNKMTDRYYAHWDYFSAFALADTIKNKNKAPKIRELEAVLIAAMPRAMNSSTPRFQPVHIPKAIRRKLAENQASSC